MKKITNKGFTLIELLAVITIMGILMLVAIPAISRTIENTRRDTFANTAKTYISSARNMWLSDSFECNTGTAASQTWTIASGLPAGIYYILIKSDAQGTAPYPFLLQQGGASSWSNRTVTGLIQVQVSGSGTQVKQNFAIALADGTHGIKALTTENSIKRSSVAVTGATAILGASAVDYKDAKATVTNLGKGLDTANVTTTKINDRLCREA